MTGMAAAGSSSGSPRERDAVDPVEGGAGDREPEPAPRRGWAIDTTPLRNPAYRRLFWGVAATMLGQQMTLVAARSRSTRSPATH